MSYIDRIIKNQTTLECDNVHFTESNRGDIIKLISNNFSTLKYVNIISNNVFNKILLNHPSFKHMLLEKLELNADTLNMPELNIILKYIKNSSILEHFSLTKSCNDHVQHQLIEYLITKTTLKFLMLREVEMSSFDSFYALSKLICINTSLEHLDLSSNNLTSNAIHIICTGMKYNMKLRTLILRNNNLYHKGRQNGAFAIGDMLRFNMSLRKLDLSKCNLRNGVKYVLKSLKRNCTLRKLNISNNNIKDKVGKILEDALNKNKTLLSLKLKDNNIKKKCWNRFNKIASPNSRLKSLTMLSDYIDPDMICGIIGTIMFNKNLEKLRIGSFGVMDLYSMQHSEQMIQHTNSGTLTLEQMIQIQYTNLRTLTLDQMMQHKNLKTLTLENIHIQSPNAKYLFRGLAFNSCLRSLTLSNTNMDVLDGGFYYSGDKKKVLNTYDNITYATDQSRGTAYLLEAMQSNRTLKYLTLSDGLFDKTSYTNIINIFAVNNTLKKITFNGKYHDISSENKALFLNVLNSKYSTIDLTNLCPSHEQSNINMVYFLDKNASSKKYIKMGLIMKKEEDRNARNEEYENNDEYENNGEY